MIPARIGSVRLRYKNLALLNKRAVIEYAIINAIESKIFSKIFINSDSEKFKFFSEYLHDSTNNEAEYESLIFLKEKNFWHHQKLGVMMLSIIL